MTATHDPIESLCQHLTDIIGETNGITLSETLCLMLASDLAERDAQAWQATRQFQEMLADFQVLQADIRPLLEHPLSRALYRFFKRFPLHYREDHIHLTGSLTAEFIWPRLSALLEGPEGSAARDKIRQVFGSDGEVLESREDVQRLIRLKDEERFDRYLQILLLPKLILTSRERHAEAAYAMAQDLYHRCNVGNIRLKFTLSRSPGNRVESIPGLEHLQPEDVAMGLYEGFTAFKREQPDFGFILSPCFRKEADFYDRDRYASKGEDVSAQVETLLDLIERNPCLRPHLCEVDTVGNEREFYRKSHFKDLHIAFRKLQHRGFQVRSHHGETWKTLRWGIQAVDNAMNIWNIDALEHGLSLGINPNYYFHSLYQRVLRNNQRAIALTSGTQEFHEISDMDWAGKESVREKILIGVPLSQADKTLFTKVKFHAAGEVERYQHDVLNRMIQKRVSLISLPSSNYKLTSCFADFKDHPFSWWEKKGLELGVGTDNYITLGTDFINEMLILLCMDPLGLKITKLLMITTGEKRRPLISNLLWRMHSKK